MKRRSVRMILSVCVAASLVSCSENEQKPPAGGSEPRAAQKNGGEGPAPTPTSAPTPTATPTPVPTGKMACENGRKLTILGTNDIHGNFEGKVFSISGPDGPKKKVGGLALFAGVVKNLRDQSDDCNGVIVLDGGDQFQGTLISNFNEGKLMGEVMKEIGYDAIVPGNHDYDFGPMGWEDDSVQHASESRLNALERFSLRARRRIDGNAIAVKGAASGGLGNAPASNVDPKSPKATIIQFKNSAQIPLLSANTYKLDSLRDQSGETVPASLIGCRPEGEKKIDWSRAERPEFLAPYAMKEVAGMKVAIVGLDLTLTPSVTTKANVLDLCFRDPVEEFLSISKELRKKADAIVVVAHFGNATADAIELTREAKAPTEPAGDDVTITSFLDRILTSPACADKKCIDALVGGHAHAVNNVRISGVPAIQSGSNAQRFGRIELKFTADRKPKREETKSYAGKYMVLDQCDKGTEAFCEETPDGAKYDGKLLAESEKIQELIALEKQKVSLISERVVGKVSEEMAPNRSNESALGNRLADMLLAIGKPMGGTVSFLNSGGIRTSLKKGQVTYAQFYEVLPFNNRAVVVPNFKVSDLIVSIKKTIQTCGAFGTLNYGGIRFEYRKDCVSEVNKQRQEDPNAELLKVTTVDGEVYYDASLPEGQRIPEDKEIRLVTLDFLAEGGSAFADAFRPEHVKQVISRPYREKFVEVWLEEPFEWNNQRDQRMKNVFVPPAT